MGYPEGMRHEFLDPVCGLSEGAQYKMDALYKALAQVRELNATLISLEADGIDLERAYLSDLESDVGYWIDRVPEDDEEDRRG